MTTPDVRRRSNDELLFALMFALATEHERHMGHRPFEEVVGTGSGWRVLTIGTRGSCDTCRYLKMVCVELELRLCDPEHRS